MRVAVVHGLLRGGAARRLAGTVSVLGGMAGLTLAEFSFGQSVAVLPEAVQRTVWTPEAPARPRLVRPLWRYADLVSARSAWRHLWAEVNAWNPDVVFANPCSVPGGAPPGLSAARAVSLYYCDEPRRVDYELEAARSTKIVTRLPYALMRRVERADERASVAAAGGLVTNSLYTAGRIYAAYGRTAEIVTPGIAEIFRPGPEREIRHVLSVGTLIPSKGHDLVIEAAAASEVDLPVVLVAPRIDPTEVTRLEALARRRGVDLSIRVGISDEELADLYRGALATLYLARDEPLGLVSLESQACGTPVIVAREGGLVETVEHGVGGFHVARLSDEAAAALTQMLDPNRRARLVEGALSRPIPRDHDAAVAIASLLRDGVGRDIRPEQVPPDHQPGELV